MTEDPVQAMVSVIPGDEGKSKFKQCEQIAFYRRQKETVGQVYRLLLDTLVLTPQAAELHLIHSRTQERLVLTLCALRGGVLRVMVDELQARQPRYRVADVLDGEPVPEPLLLQVKEHNTLCLRWGDAGQYQVRLQACPFMLEVLCDGETTVTLNQEGRLFFETLQDPSKHRLPSHSGKEDHDDDDDDPAGLWTETFKQFVDIKANGPSSVGLDLSLHGFSHVYGLPEHSDGFQLKDTSVGGAYRLYNLDVFAYELNSRLGLYGSVPLLLAHKPNTTVGVFWLNASETLVDLCYRSEDVALSPKKSRRPPRKKTRKVFSSTALHWMSESGVIDTFLLLGSTPAQTLYQYSQLTGNQAMPPLFSLGYHQSRWNYEDEADVRAVDAGFDHHSIPYDVIWLDIEHTDGKRYFTWDKKLFPDPVGLQRHLQERKRKLVVISDPHIKADPDWCLYGEAKEQGHFVRNRCGELYEGSCWPGDSCYLDFSNPKTRAWYSGLYTLDKYKGSTENLFVWNDMNEPSVFSGPEMTMPKDAVHYGGWEHRDLHNMYGFYQHMATVKGLELRCGGRERPFVLSRSFFAGSQRLGAVWTGDNVATWEYLKMSIPMLLSLSVVGMCFCGADVGGFFQDPDVELLVRWYQAGSLQPFFRGHSAKQMKRREPWLFGDAATATIRTAVTERYRLLPYWYTLFHYAHTTAQPPMRPLWLEFPGEESVFSVEHQYMIGGALLACPVTDPGVTTIKVLLPKADECWYNVHTNQMYRGGRTVSLPVTMDTVPIFQRAGTVVPRKTEAGHCTADTDTLPICLTVAVDYKGCAEGELYLDDGHSFCYRDEKQFALRKFKLRKNTLACCSAEDTGLYMSECTVLSVRFLGMKKPSTVTAHVLGADEVSCVFHYQKQKHLLTVEKLSLPVGKDWEIRIHS